MMDPGRRGIRMEKAILVLFLPLGLLVSPGEISPRSARMGVWRVFVGWRSLDVTKEMVR